MMPFHEMHRLCEVAVVAYNDRTKASSQAGSPSHAKDVPFRAPHTEIEATEAGEGAHSLPQSGLRVP